jgi:hypothetical protein
LKSPKLRERLRPPLTRPFTISPPAAAIRLRSISFSGLWS